MPDEPAQKDSWLKRRRERRAERRAGKPERAQRKADAIARRNQLRRGGRGRPGTPDGHPGGMDPGGGAGGL